MIVRKRDSDRRAAHYTSPTIMWGCIVTTMFLVCVITTGSHADDVNYEYLLGKTIFVNYSRNARPVLQANDSVPITIQFAIGRIGTLNEKAQIFETFGWLMTTWNDPFLHWLPSDYGGLERITARSDDIWIPEVILLNSVDDGSDLAIAENKYRVQIYANGDIIWIPGVRFRTSCKVDLTRFPFDIQTCYINITSWLYTTEYINFNVTTAEVNLDHLESNGEWDVTRTSEGMDTIDSAAGTMSYVYCVVELKLRAQYYLLHILMPVIAMSTVSMFVFAMPVESGEKISLGISVLISYSVFTILVTDIMPANADAMPVLTYYINICMVMTAVSIMLTVVVLNIHHRSSKVAVPAFIRVLVIGFLGRLLLVTSKTNRPRHGPEAKEDHQLHHTSEHRNKTTRNERNANHIRSRMSLTTVSTPDVYAGPAREVLDHSEQWQLAASILDRFFLVIYFIAILGLTIWTGVNIS